MHSHSRSSIFLALCLSLLAGFVDALGFLQLGGFFVSFMSGNSTRFGVGLMEDLPLHLALLPLGIIVFFIIGVMAGRLIGHRWPNHRSFAILSFITLLLFIACVLHLFGLGVFGIPFMIVGMGAANNIFVRDGEVAIAVTYMTGSLVKLGQRLADNFLNKPNSAWLPYLLLWLAFIAGAVGGTMAYTMIGLSGLWMAFSMSLFLTVFSKKFEVSGN